jgi:hypothetical protein
MHQTPSRNNKRQQYRQAAKPPTTVDPNQAAIDLRTPPQLHHATSNRSLVTRMEDDDATKSIKSANTAPIHLTYMDIHDDTQWSTVSQRSFVQQTRQQGAPHNKGGRGGRGGGISQRSYKYRSTPHSFNIDPAPTLAKGINQLRQTQEERINPAQTQQSQALNGNAQYLKDKEHIEKGGYYDALKPPDDEDDGEATTDSTKAALKVAAELEDALIAEYEADLDALLNDKDQVPNVVLSPTRQLNPEIQQAIVLHNPYSSKGFRKRTNIKTSSKDGHGQSA